MGWTGMYPPSHRDKKQWLQEQFTSENENFRWGLTDISVRGSVAYAIYHQEDKKTGISLHETMVILLSCRKDEWAYKEMGETVHPYYYDCPKKLLDKIDAMYPPFNEQARAWRNKCREQVSKKQTATKLENGTVIKFDTPLNFGWFTEDVFAVVKDGAKVRFRSRKGTLCRITNYKDRPYKVLADLNEIITDYEEKYGQRSN